LNPIRQNAPSLPATCAEFSLLHFLFLNVVLQKRAQSTLSLQLFQMQTEHQLSNSNTTKENSLL